MSSGVVSRRMRSDLCVVNSSTRPPFSVKPINVTKMYISVCIACSTTLCHLRTLQRWQRDSQASPGILCGGSTEMEKMNYVSKSKSSKPPRKGHKETSKPSVKSEKPISTAVC